MRGLTIQARSYDSAQAFSSALSEFYPEIHGNDDEGYVVRVPVDNSDGHVIELLDAIMRHVTEQDTFAHLKLDGRQYTIQSESRA